MPPNGSAPHDDMKLGLHKTARYYYYPGWHEPGTVNDFGFNKKAYEALPADLRRTLDHAVAATQVYMLSEYAAKNAIAVERLRTEFKDKVEILPLPVPVLRDLKKLAADVVKETSEKTPMARRVHASFTKFQAQLAGWSRASRKAPTTSPWRCDEAQYPPTPTRNHMERRRFIVRAGGDAGGRRGRSYRRRSQRHRPAEGPVADVHRFAPALDMHQGVAQRFAKAVDEMSGGRFRIEVLAGGQIMAPFDCFDAASQGTIEAFMAPP